MKQRIIATVLALVLVVFSVPVNEIACWAETIPENTEIKVKVTDLDIVARMDSYGISEKIGYEGGKNDYSVRMSKYIPLSVGGQDLTVDENTGTYTYETEYSAEGEKTYEPY